jgi:hypothetical protein
LVGEVRGLSNPSEIEYVALPLVDVPLLMLVVVVVTFDVDVPPMFDGVVMFVALLMFVAPDMVIGELDMTAIGFCMTCIGLVGVPIGVGFMTTGVALITTGVGFAMDPMPDIPDAMDSRLRPSSASTEIGTLRARLCAIVLFRFCSSRGFIGLILRELSKCLTEYQT